MSGIEIPDNTGLITVITPAYNAELYIGATIESVLAQTYDNWEMIVIDDCSTDATRDIVQGFAVRDKRIRLIALEANNGAPAIPRNIGVENAKGAWIALLDADDIWHPEKLEIQLALMVDKGIGFSSTRMSDFTDSESITFNKVKAVDYQLVSFLDQKIKGRIPASSVVVRKDILLEFPFEKSIAYKAVEDYHCWLRIHEKYGESIKVSHPLLFYRKVQGQISGSKTYMIRKIYMVHKEYFLGSPRSALLFTITHILGGFYYRYLGKGL